MRQQRFSKGFTLVEILVVVMIIGMLSYLSLARFDVHRKQTADRTTKANIENLRMAISLFYDQEGQWPNSSLSDLVSGSPSGTKYIAKIPQEAVKNSSTVVTIPTYLGGWHWDTINHKLHPNLMGSDSFGVLYNEY